MKVLLQEWMTDRGFMRSISKDQAQLEETIQRLKAKGNAEPQGSVAEVEIPDNHGLVEIVEDDTIFLHKDEEDVIEYPD